MGFLGVFFGAQVLMEDRQTNRLVESMNIFETIVNNKLFLNVSIILFLNKTDLLVEKIRTVDIRKNFPEFRGDPRRLEDVQVCVCARIITVIYCLTLPHTHTHTLAPTPMLKDEPAPAFSHGNLRLWKQIKHQPRRKM